MHYSPTLAMSDPEFDAYLEEFDYKSRRAIEAKRVELFRTFRESLAMDEPSPLPKVGGAEIETLIVERPELVAKILGWVARNEASAPGLGYMFRELADAWIVDVEKTQ